MDSYILEKNTLKASISDDLKLKKVQKTSNSSVSDHKTSIQMIKPGLAATWPITAPKYMKLCVISSDFQRYRF